MVTVHIYVQNMTLDEFKNELDGKLEKVLTMKYYLTKLYKGGSASRNRDNIDTSSTTSVATTNRASSGSTDSPIFTRSADCGLVASENPDGTFSWKCCCCAFKSTGKNLKSTRESYRKHHKNWHSPDGIAAQNALLAAQAALDPTCPPIMKKRRGSSLGAVPRKSRVLAANMGAADGTAAPVGTVGNVPLVSNNIDDLLVANAGSFSMNLSDADAAILVDAAMNEDDFSSLFDD
jgi:hypothetical protein